MKPIKDCLKVKLKKNLLTITFGVDYLKHVAENDPELEGFDKATGDLVPAKVTDKKIFAKEVLESLEKELDETGLTVVYEMIDKAIRNAVENGCEGIYIHGN
jgi:hypothetical protein